MEVIGEFFWEIERFCNDSLTSPESVTDTGQTVAILDTGIYVRVTPYFLLGSLGPTRTGWRIFLIRNTGYFFFLRVHRYTFEVFRFNM